MSNISKRFVRLGDVCKTTSGGTPSRTRKDYYGGSIPWVKSGELCDGVVINIYETITEEGLNSSSAKVFPKGSLLIALYGATVGRLGILSRDAATNQAVCAIFPHEGIDTKYLFWFLRSIRSELIDMGQGGAQPNISQGIVKDILFPLVPLEEQWKIVAEIEKQFSRLDEAVASLKRIQANLKRYKAAVLKAAVEGKLTEQWRKEHPDVEPAEQLLKRILAERRAKWEAEELAKMKAKGSVGVKHASPDSWKKKYKEPAGPDTANLPELPEGWRWVTLEQLTTQLMNGFGKRSQHDGVPTIVLRLADLQNGEIIYSDVRRINCTAEDIGKYGLFPNDILVLRVNGSPDLVGRFVLVRQVPGDVLYCDHFIRARFSGPAQALWLRMYSDVQRFRRYVDLNKVSSAGQNTINQGVLSIFSVPFPPLEEQLLIAAELDRRFSVTDELAVTIETNLKRAERLRQTFLQKAFSCQLSPK